MEYANVRGYKISRLILGTVQFGLNYGIANKNGKPSKKEAEKIINFALDFGINAFDTARAYGDSEKILGEVLDSYSKKDKIIIITKLSPEIDKSMDEREIQKNIENSVRSSINNLRLNSIPIYILHRAEHLTFRNGIIMKNLLKLKKEGLIQNIGVSVYTSDEAETALSFDEITAIQVPFNIFDHRLIKSGFFERAYSKGVAVFVRSIYLQGLILMNNKDVPEKLKDIIPFKNKLNKICNNSGKTINEIAMKFPLAQKGVTGIIFGVDNLSQLKENIGIYEKPQIEEPIIKNILNSFDNIPDYLLDPRQWI